MKFHIKALFFVFLLSSCSDSSTTSGVQEQQLDKAQSPDRVVVLGPSIAEVMEELGLLNHVHGIGKFGPWPELIADRPVVGGFSNPNIEQIISMEIDTVLNIKSQAAKASHERLRALGIRVVELDTATFEGIFASIQTLGDLFDQQASASTLVNKLQSQMVDIEQQAKGLQKRKVLFVVDENPLYVAGPGSHLDRLIQMVGGENVAHDALSPYQQLSMEAVLERKPEVIIDTSDNGADGLRGRQTGRWQRWDFLPAVQNERVYWVDPSRLVIPAVRLSEMALLMGKIIHPEVFGEPLATEYHQSQ